MEEKKSQTDELIVSIGKEKAVVDEAVEVRALLMLLCLQYAVAAVAQWLASVSVSALSSVPVSVCHAVP